MAPLAGISWDQLGHPRSSTGSHFFANLTGMASAPHPGGIAGALSRCIAGALSALSALSARHCRWPCCSAPSLQAPFHPERIWTVDRTWNMWEQNGTRAPTHTYTYIYIYILHTFIRAYIEILFNIIWWFWFWLWHRLNTHCCAPFMSGNKGRDSLAFDTHESLSTTRASPFPKIKYTSKINGPPRSMDQIHPIKSIKH